MKYDISMLSTEEKIGQLLVASIDGFTLDDAAKAFLDTCHIGNIIHFGNNVRDCEQAAALNAALDAHIRARGGIPPLIGIDHEGGRVTRFLSGVTVFPAAMAIGATGDLQLAEAVGRAMGRELRTMGFSINFAPVLDVNTNPHNPVIGTRAYGDDPEHVASFGIAMAKGMQAEGLAACGKHFPGHGDTDVDSHYGLPSVDKPLDMLEKMDLLPFQRAIDAGIASLMTTHILFPQLEQAQTPATMSTAILQGLLRQRMGFDGLIISDGMQMEAITKWFGLERGSIEAVKAGVDLLCIGTGGGGTMAAQISTYHALVAAVQSGEIPMARIDDAVRRVLAAKEAYSTPFTGEVDWQANAALARKAADASMTWLIHGEKKVAGKVLCASVPAPAPKYGIRAGDWHETSFANIAAKALGGEALLLGDIVPQIEAVKRADSVVMSITDGGEAESQFLQEAIAMGKRVFAVITGSPYIAAYMGPECAVLCTYGTAGLSVEAACRVLSGEIEAKGKLPVHLW